MARQRTELLINRTRALSFQRHAEETKKREERARQVAWENALLRARRRAA